MISFNKVTTNEWFLLYKVTDQFSSNKSLFLLSSKDLFLLILRETGPSRISLINSQK